jgi:exportin-2 (importin alpha re-exporter)
VARLDPCEWLTLLQSRLFTSDQQLVASLSQTDYLINLSVLETSHAIFQPWRSQVRSDDLFTEINLVLQTFMTPFLDLFRQTAQLILANGPPDLTRSQILLLDIYYDFSCQDLPPDLEDSHEEFFAPVTGWFQRFLAWEPQRLPDDARFFPALECTPF